mgnify:CR=1 FL=1
MGKVGWFGKVSFVLLIFYMAHNLLLLGCTSISCIVFVDVGQGDGAIIKIEDDFLAVIDGGPSVDYVHKISKYIDMDDEIDLLIITHMHRDHYLGVLEILKRYKVNTLVLPTSCIKAPEVLSVLEDVNVSDIKYTDFVTIKSSSSNTSVSYGKNIDECFISHEDVNDSSVIVDLELENSSVLFMGDVESKREMKFLEEYHKDVYILKAGHHCSSSSTSKEFLDAVTPDVVVCSYGKNNSYGHPHKEVLDRFVSMGINVLSNAQQGDIVINLDK